MFIISNISKILKIPKIPKILKIIRILKDTIITKDIVYYRYYILQTLNFKISKGGLGALPLFFLVCNQN